MSINNVILSGRLTADPELKMSQNNKKYCQFTLAVDKYVNGQQQADFISCIAWERTAEVLTQYTKKGSKVNVAGRISTRTYKNNQGINVYVTEVIVQQLELLDSKPKEEKPQQQQSYDDTSSFTITSDDLPF